MGEKREGEELLKVVEVEHLHLMSKDSMSAAIIKSLQELQVNQ